jgi:hypothetical protein
MAAVTVDGKYDITFSVDPIIHEAVITVETETADSNTEFDQRQEFRDLPQSVIEVIEKFVRQAILGPGPVATTIIIALDLLFFRRWEWQIFTVLRNYAKGYRGRFNVVVANNVQTMTSNEFFGTDDILPF